jgi:hypothetical protein
MPDEYDAALDSEAESWLGSDSFADKTRRERIRHHRLIKDLLLDRLGTSNMSILEIGGGPMPVSDLLSFRCRLVIDPLSEKYREAFPCRDHLAMEVEQFAVQEPFADLVIATNSLDHVRMPATAMSVMMRATKPGGYMAILCAENNAITNPHPSHRHNLTASWVHHYLDATYETVWELTYEKDGYRYGWAPWEGKRGQPAFAMLMRRCDGYV